MGGKNENENCGQAPLEGGLNICCTHCDKVRASGVGQRTDGQSDRDVPEAAMWHQLSRAVSVPEKKTRWPLPGHPSDCHPLAALRTWSPERPGSSDGRYPLRAGLSGRGAELGSPELPALVTVSHGLCFPHDASPLVRIACMCRALQNA